MRKTNLILIGQTITAILYIVVYLVKTFIIWEFTNPFSWIINMPNYNNETRVFIMFGIVFYYCFLYGILYDSKESIKQLLNK